MIKNHVTIQLIGVEDLIKRVIGVEDILGYKIHFTSSQGYIFTRVEDTRSNYSNTPN
jgi:hypothetical protein